jgi:peptidyl-prolyl cis-trans isomerase C
MNAVQQVRDALLARAGVLGVTGSTEEAVIDALLEREVRTEAPTEDECRAHYVANPDAFRPGSIAEVDHILFAVTDPQPHPALRAKAEALLAELVADDRGFAEAARSASNCPSADVGGNLGQLTAGDVVPEFWRQLTAHGQPGVLPQLVESRFGLHIVRINRIAPGKLLPFEVARPRIEEHLAERKLRGALHDYVHGLVHPHCDDEHAHEHDCDHHHHPHAMNDSTQFKPAEESTQQGSAAERWATAVRRHDQQQAAQETDKRSNPPAPQATGCGGGGGCACAGT